MCRQSGNLSFVLPGLDPGIHEAARRTQFYRLYSRTFIMDCRVELGNDERGAYSIASSDIANHCASEVALCSIAFQPNTTKVSPRFHEKRWSPTVLSPAPSITW